MDKQLTTDENVKYGLVYVEDIYNNLEKFGAFGPTECSECRKAVCKLRPIETKYYRDLFIERANKELATSGLIYLHTGKLFDILAKALRHAHYKSHTLGIMLNDCKHPDPVR